MSLVDRYDSWQRKLFAVPQGITGWWQFNGRSDKPMHLHTDDDPYYVYNLLAVVRYPDPSTHAFRGDPRQGCVLTPAAHFQAE